MPTRNDRDKGEAITGYEAELWKMTDALHGSMARHVSLHNRTSKHGSVQSLHRTG